MGISIGQYLVIWMIYVICSTSLVYFLTRNCIDRNSSVVTFFITSVVFPPASLIYLLFIGFKPRTR